MANEIFGERHKGREKIVGDFGCGGMVGILAMHPVVRRCFAWMLPGRFMFFAPGELHRPMVRTEGIEPVKKLVFKISDALLRE